MSVVPVLAIALCVSLCHASALFPKFPSRGHRVNMPRCTAATKPCRVRAVMEGGPEMPWPHVITGQPCSCPGSLTCSDDWERNADRVIHRSLMTNGNINMTLSMMFCTAVQPQTRCQDGEVALQLTGMSYLPTEVDFIQCSCGDPRPLVLDRTFTGRDHRSYHRYVCPTHKRRCNLSYSSRDVCMTTDPMTDTTSYPCKCPFETVCRPPNFVRGEDFYCLPRMPMMSP